MLCVVALSIIAAPPGPARGGEPTEALRPAVDQVLRILADPALTGTAHTLERRRALHAAMEGVIDFPDAARRALGVHWQARTEAEREEFVALFKELVTHSYIATMEAYAGQTVVFASESERDGIATVVTKVESRQSLSIPIEYRMHRRDARWLVHDVIVEGVSLVGNYRTQFNSIIRTTSYAELVRRMKSRIRELSGGSPVAFTRPPAIRALPGGLP
jgi:phospholipid transport system substrate-binding protein